MKLLKNTSGFTLLELIISITIIVVIVGIALGGIRLGLSARDIGEQRADTYQRLRFIGEQISKKIKSMHPLFIAQQQEEVLFQTEEMKTIPKKYLAFEGLPDSLRIITFAKSLSMVKTPSWMHEVRFFLGTHPKTLERGIIMMERNLAIDDVFTEVQPDSNGVSYIMLANEVDHLQFRYFKMKKVPVAELGQQGGNPLKYTGEWVDSIIIKPEVDEAELFFSETEESSATKKNDKISLPRAMEISIGLNQPVVSANAKEPEIVYLPPTIIPFHSGMEFSRPLEEEDEAS